MVFCLEIIVLGFFVILGYIVARSIKSKSLFIDFLFIFFFVISTWIGKDTYLIKVFNFELLLPTVIQAIILGILLKHFFLKRIIRLET